MVVLYCGEKEAAWERIGVMRWREGAKRPRKTRGVVLPDPPNEEQHRTRHCATCASVVDRKNCHRNRFGEHICRQCQARGIRFSPRYRTEIARRRVRTIGSWVIWLLLLVGAVIGYYGYANQPKNAPSLTLPPSY